MHLNAWNMSDGTVEIHKHSCSHHPGSGRAKARFQDQVEFGTADWATKFDFCHDYWDNGILEESERELGVGSFDVFACMEFKPCTKSLPVGGQVTGTDAQPLPEMPDDDFVPAINPEEPADKRNSIATRREGRRHLLIAMEAERDNVLTYDRELAESMSEQIKRVSMMFGFAAE